MINPILLGVNIDYMKHMQNMLIMLFIKISHSEDTRLPILWMGGADTTKIMPPKLSLAYMYLLHIDWKLFCFYYKFKFCFPDILGVVGGCDTPIIMSPKLS